MTPDVSGPFWDPGLICSLHVLAVLHSIAQYTESSFYTIENAATTDAVHWTVDALCYNPAHETIR